MPPECTFELVVRHGVVVGSFAGELDRADTDGLRERLLDALSAEGHALVCDLSLLSYIDSAGVHFLYRLSQTLQTEGQQMALILPGEPTPRRVLDIVGLTEAIPRFATVDDAVIHLGTPERSV